MCLQPLLDYVAPFKLARQAQALEGLLPLKRTERLARTLYSKEAEISFKLVFGVDEGGTYFAKGSVIATLELECQRCLQAVPTVLNVDIALAFFSSEKGADRVSNHYEPIVVKDEQVDLAELIEDELLLALPIVAKHAEQDCQPKFDNAVEAVVDEKPNPFAVLAQLKNATDD